VMEGVDDAHAALAGLGDAGVDFTDVTDTLEREGVDTQIITLTTPGTHVEPPARAVRLASLVNDEFAAIVRERRSMRRRGRPYTATANAAARTVASASGFTGFEGAAAPSQHPGETLEADARPRRCSDPDRHGDRRSSGRLLLAKRRQAVTADRQQERESTTCVRCDRALGSA